MSDCRAATVGLQFAILIFRPRFCPNLSTKLKNTYKKSLYSNVHPNIFASINTIEEYTVHKNLLIAYSSQSSQNAYEELQIECSTTINNDQTYELKTGDTDRIVPRASQYVNSLCTRIDEDLDANTLLDKVHEGMLVFLC